ncbi:MAG TPA: TIM-barrel domain-containing protein, partial [Limnochorda sp.]
MRQTLHAVSPPMIGPALVYPLRKAVSVVRATQPELKGLAYLRAVWRELKAPKPTPLPVEGFLQMGAARRLEMVDERTVRIVMEEGTLQVRALAPDLFQLRYRPDDRFEPPFSYSVVQGEEAWPSALVAVEESPARVEIRTGSLALTLDKASGRVALKDSAGRLFFGEGWAAARHREGNQVTWHARFPEETPFYGLGEKAAGLNLAGKRFELWNTDPSGYSRGDDPIYLSVPWVMGLVGGQAIGLFFDNTYRAWVDLGSREPGAFSYAAAGGELRLYVITGTPAQVLERYTQLTGRAKLPPLWAFGLHQSRWSYYPQERVLEVAREFRRRRIPCDVIHLDIHYLDG